MKELINIKNVAGVGVGVALGHFVFKSKNPLVLMAFGLGGGIIAHTMIKTNSEKKANVKKATDNYLESVSRDVEATLNTGMDNPSDKGGLAFNKEVGYITPYGEVDEENPTEFMDIGF